MLLDDGRMLISGGYTGIANNNFIVPFPLDTVDVYDPGTGRWSAVPLVDQSSRLNRVLKLPDGTVLFVGVVFGTDEQVTGAAYGLDTNDLSWRQFADPPTARSFHQMVLMADGRVMVAGGIDLNDEASSFRPELLNTVDIFDPDANMWQQAAPMSTASEELWLFPLSDGRVLSILEEDEASSESPVHAQLYDPDTDTWTVVDSADPYYLPTGAVQLSDGRVLVAGRLNLSGPGRYGFSEDRLTYVELPDGRRYYGELVRDLFPEAKVYDPATDTWTATLGSLGGRTSASLTLLRDGRVLVAGGEEDTMYDFGLSGEDFGFLSTTAVYDPELNFWSPGPDLTERRIDHSATLIPDGRVIFLGGIGLTEVSTDREELVPINVLEVVESMAIPQIDPAAVFIEAEEYSCETVPIPASSAGLTQAGRSLAPIDILGAARVAMNELDSYHVQLRWAIVDDETDSGFGECERLATDFQAPDRFRADHSRYYALHGEYSFQMISLGHAAYETNRLAGEWESNDIWVPEFLTDRLEPIGDNFISDLRDASIEGIERLNDVDVYRIAGTISTVALFGEFQSYSDPGELELLFPVVYWVGVDDYLIRMISAEGVFEDEELGLLRSSVTVEYSAFGEEVFIEAPEVGATS